MPGRLAGERFVDVNAFPTMAIERIDVLKEGAGAVCGSDAMAGVVNFVTRGGFEGFEVKGAYGYFADAGDGTVGAIWGHHFENGPHLVASIDHRRRAQLTAPDRDGTLRPHHGWGWGWSGTGNPGTFMVPGSPDVNVDVLSASLRFLDPGCEGMISIYEDRSGGDEYGTMDPFLTLDATFRRRFPDLGMTVRLSALNLTNRWPPVVNAELGHDGLTHDFKGRRIKLAVTYAFGS